MCVSKGKAVCCEGCELRSDGLCDGKVACSEFGPGIPDAVDLATGAVEGDYDWAAKDIDFRDPDPEGFTPEELEELKRLEQAERA